MTTATLLYSASLYLSCKFIGGLRRSLPFAVLAFRVNQVCCTIHPRRRVVGRCFAWLDRCLAMDFETTIESATAFLYPTSAKLLLSRMMRVLTGSRFPQHRNSRGNSKHSWTRGRLPARAC